MKPVILISHKFENDPQRGDIMIFYPPFVKLKATPWSVFSRLTGFFCNDTAQGWLQLKMGYLKSNLIFKIQSIDYIYHIHQKQNQS